MDIAEMKLLQENVEEFVMDENKIVTFKYLACTLDISIDSAKRVLRDYVFPDGKRRTEVNITYVLGGHLLDNQGYKISLVREDDVPEVEKHFSSVELKEIFCVHKVSSVLDLNIIYGIDGNLHNVKPRVTCKNAVERAKRTQPALPASAPKPPIKAVPSAIIKQVVKEPELPSVATVQPGIASIFGSAASKKSPVVNSNAAKPKKGGGIASFFSKHDKVVPISKPLDSMKVELTDKETSKDIKTEPSKTVTAAGSSKENSPKNEIPPQNSAKSSKSSKKRKKHAEKETVAGKRRRRIMVVSDSESSAGEESEEDERCPSPEAPPPDFRAESSDEEIVPATPETGTGSRKKVLRVKTTMDDEGYVVTTKEWVWEEEGGGQGKEKKEDVVDIKCDQKKTEEKTKKHTIEELMELEDKKEEKGTKNKHAKGKRGKSEEEEEEEGEEEEIEETPRKNSKKLKKAKNVKSKENEEEKEEETPKRHKKEQKVKEIVKAKAEKVKASKKKEVSSSDESEAKVTEKKRKTKPTEASQDAKKAGSKRKLIEVVSSEDESQGKQEKAAKKQPAKKQPPKKKSPPKASGTQTNIMSFFGKK